MSNLSKFKFTLILSCLLFLLTLSGCTDFFPAKYEPAGEKDPVTIAKSTYSTLIVDIDLNVGAIHLNVIPTATYLVDVVTAVFIREGSGGTLAEAQEVSSSEIDTDTMRIAFDSADDNIRVDYKYILTINIGNNISLNINCVTTTGEVTADFSDSTVEISAFYLEATTGSISLTMSEVLISDSSPTVKTTTGEQVAILTNLQYASATTWSISSTTGSLDLDLTENVPRNLTGVTTHIFNLECTTGSVDVLADLEQTTGIQVSTEITTGNIDLPGGGSSFTSDSFATALLKYVFNLQTTTGSISFTT